MTKRRTKTAIEYLVSNLLSKNKSYTAGYWLARTQVVKGLFVIFWTAIRQLTIVYNLMWKTSHGNSYNSLAKCINASPDKNNPRVFLRSKTHGIH